MKVFVAFAMMACSHVQPAPATPRSAGSAVVVVEDNAPDRDAEPADDSAIAKLYDHYAELAVSERVSSSWHSGGDHVSEDEARREVYSAGPLIMLGVCDGGHLTKGQVACALAAVSATEFRACCLPAP